MSVAAHSYEYASFPELARSRVLITGLSSAQGFDVARAFADHGARLVIQSAEDTPEMTELAAVLAQSTSDLTFFNTPLLASEDAKRLGQGAAQSLGGIDSVVNLVSLDARAMRAVETMGDVDALVAQALRNPLLLTEVVANRMRLTWTEGSILNVVAMPDAFGGRATLVADALRAELADMTRGLAERWAEHGVRVNAVGPPSSVATLMGGAGRVADADLAALALRLASGKCRSVSGHLLDPEGAARRWC
jgi:NAD(P)-dependent dehydrogenase (short-subunit alcohol dehydrogenase family)